MHAHTGGTRTEPAASFAAQSSPRSNHSGWLLLAWGSTLLL